MTRQIETRIRLHEGTLKGEIMADGMRAYFDAQIRGQRLDATFTKHLRSEKDLDQWALFQLLQRWIETNMAG